MADGEDWVVKVDPSNRQAIETREIYGYAGMALSMAQNLEHTLKNFVVLARAIETYPKSAEEQKHFQVEMGQFEARIFRRTLGPLIRSIEDRFHFSTKPSLIADLEQSLIDRNQLIHHFFWDRSVQLMRSSEERRAMAEELRRIHQQLRKTIEDFSDATNGIRDALGITDEAIEEVVRASLAGASQDEVKEMIRTRRASAHAKKLK